MPDSPPVSFLLGLRFRAEDLLLRALAWGIPQLSLGIVRAGAVMLGTVAWVVDYRGRRAGMENLRAVFAREGMTPGRRSSILRQSYRLFARTWCELFWGCRLSEENWDQHFVLECDTAAAAAAFAEDHCLYATAHFGNFEWLSLGRALKGGKSMIIAQNFKNPPLTALFRELRACGGRQVIVPQEGAMLRLFKHLRRGGSAAALVDLNVRPDQAAAVIECFGLSTSVSILHCALAARTGVPVVPVLALPDPDGRWRLRFFDPLHVAPNESLAAAAQRCWDVFEPVFRARPECWLWMYKHWRYLPEGADPAWYPAYANRSKKFDRLAAAVAAGR